MRRYFRPVPQTDLARPATARPLAGGWCWFEKVEVLSRGAASELIDAAALPPEVLERLSAPRAPILGYTMDAPRLMGIVNVTPDSFSDGGQFSDHADAVAQARALAEGGADILDIGGESTRPGSEAVDIDEEIRRVVPVIEALSAENLPPVSIDTRKAAVAEAAVAAGARLINDVSALSFDPALSGVAAAHGLPVCLMHAQGDPKTMQRDPRYDDVLLDVYDYLEARIAVAEAAGIARRAIVVDPGIGFGKTLDHNLRLLRNIALFHGLGCPILVGASRKRFIGTLSGVAEAGERVPGSVAVALAAVGQGVQLLRVHDIDATKQALRLDGAVRGRDRE